VANDAQAGEQVRGQKTMTFWEHIGELRRRIFFALAALVAGMVVAFLFRVWIYDVLLKPLNTAAPDVHLTFLAIQEPWLIYFRLAFFGGLVLASPFVLWQAWAFVAPALKPAEKRAVLPVMPVVLALFVAGVLFVYYVLLPVSIAFLLGFAHQSAQPMLTQERYFGFVTALCVAGGLLFELPAVMAVLGWLGLVSARWLWQRTGWALVVLMTLAAIITPTGDAFNMLVLTAPLVALYLVGVLLVWLIQRGRRNESRADRV
jgi:sec-independent protein translocase protein TatC